MYPPLFISSVVILSGPGVLFPFSLEIMLLISLYVGISISSHHYLARGLHSYSLLVVFRSSVSCYSIASIFRILRSFLILLHCYLYTVVLIGFVLTCICLTAGCLSGEKSRDTVTRRGRERS